MSEKIGHMSDCCVHMSKEVIYQSGTEIMLEGLLGSLNAERVLIYILARDEGYTRAIADFFDGNPDAIHKQLRKFEAEGILASRSLGRTKLFVFNPRYPFLPELKQLLEKAFSYYPEEIREDLLMNRRHPRREGKP